MTPVIVSFFTLGGIYEREAMELDESCRRFGLSRHIRGVPDLGDWTTNCGMKPAFIRDRMQEYPGRPIVWVDADGRIRKPPELFYTLECDFACHWRLGAELLSGTLFFAPTRAARALVEAWCEAQFRSPRVWDQKNLQRVIESGVPPVKIEGLPSEYVRIFDDSEMGEPVIEHMQASRRYVS